MAMDTRSSAEVIFEDALNAAPGADRNALLANACGSNQALRRRIEALINAHEDAGSFLDLTEGGLSPSIVEPAEGAGDQIGNYKLLQKIGEGGFGVVYMAEQTAPVRRKVALKILKLGMDTRHVIARFEAERQALALMDHPNIATVLDAGATETGRPYFVMELVRGVPITQYCDKHNLTTNERIELFSRVCLAVQHAHVKGVIHRDIKPSNVLVTSHDGTPVPKVIDFGIAKATSQRLTEKTLFTEFRQFVGTPEYMSPEQAEMSGLDVDTRTDIYALGVLLYELLTGKTPFDGRTLREAGFDEIKRIIREVEPPKPSTRVSTLEGEGEEIARNRRTEASALSRLMRGDLDWIVMKALEKDRTRRYDSANLLAMDVQRYLRSEPVLAGRPSTVYRMQKFARRNRAAVTVVLLLTVVVLAGSAASTAGFMQARRDRDVAKAAQARSNEIAEFLKTGFASVDPNAMAGLNLNADELVNEARRVFGDAHETVAAALSSRAIQLRNAGSIVAAEDLFREALDIWQRIDGPDSMNVAAAHGRLGLLLQMRGDDEHAAAELGETLRIVELGKIDPTLDVCEPLAGLSDLAVMRRDYEESIRLLQLSLAIRRYIAPNQHYQILATENALIQTLIFAGDDDAVTDVWRDSMTTARSLYPDGSNVLANSISRFGSWLMRHELNSEAEPLFLEAVNSYRHATSPPWESFDNSLRRLQILSEDEDTVLAILDERKELAIRTLGDQDAFYAGFIWEMAREYREAGAEVRSLEIMLESQRIYVATENPLATNDHILNNIHAEAWGLVSQQDRSAEAYEVALLAVEAVIAGLDDTAAVLNTLGAARYRTGNFSGALQALRRSDSFFSERPEGSQPEDLAFMALAEFALGNKDAAQTELQRLEDRLDNGFPVTDEQRTMLEEVRTTLADDTSES